MRMGSFVNGDTGNIFSWVLWIFDTFFAEKFVHPPVY